jgi:hypothetical protein
MRFRNLLVSAAICGALALQAAPGWMGIETIPAAPHDAAAAALPEGVGLLVTVVAADGPASGLLLPGDMLSKLDEQWLIEPRQLDVLARIAGADNPVSITWTRAGKEESAKLTLAKHPMPQRAHRARWLGRGIDPVAPPPAPPTPPPLSGPDEPLPETIPAEPPPKP